MAFPLRLPAYEAESVETDPQQSGSHDNQRRADAQDGTGHDGASAIPRVRRSGYWPCLSDR